ncbi:imidazole glycerol phosphate synthase subunit HisF [Candidatus Dependentiae bacterium]|nr:imidazole glycerol phosphate synthase subunit HisF [Candidatus Dependentiae bacterium]
MLAKRIIPCLDVNEGRVVKGTNFINLKDAGDPVECAKLYDDDSADELVFLDITASFEKRDIIIDVVKKVAASIFIPFTVGGGIKKIGDIERLLKAGADKISINTQAVMNPILINSGAEQFGSQCIVVAIDCRKKNDNTGWEVFIHGGRTATGIDAVQWAKEVYNRGAGEILLTSMDKDGTKDGYDIEITAKIADSVKIPVIASGGAGDKKHLLDGLTLGKASAVLAASIFHYKKYSIREVKQYLADNGVPIRL